VAQQVLCNALGASGLHWAWAIDAASGPWLHLSGRIDRTAPRPDWRVVLSARRGRRKVSGSTSSALERDGMCSG